MLFFSFTGEKKQQLLTVKNLEPEIPRKISSFRSKQPFLIFHKCCPYIWADIMALWQTTTSSFILFGYITFLRQTEHMNPTSHLLRHYKTSQVCALLACCFHFLSTGSSGWWVLNQILLLPHIIKLFFSSIFTECPSIDFNINESQTQTQHKINASQSQLLWLIKPTTEFLTSHWSKHSNCWPLTPPLILESCVNPQHNNRCWETSCCTSCSRRSTLRSGMCFNLSHVFWHKKGKPDRWNYNNVHKNPPKLWMNRFLTCQDTVSVDFSPSVVLCCRTFSPFGSYAIAVCTQTQFIISQRMTACDAGWQTRTLLASASASACSRVAVDAVSRRERPGQINCIQDV